MALEIRIKPQHEELPSLAQQVEDWCSEQELDVDDTYAVMLAVEELSSNTVAHAPSTDDDAFIRVRIEIKSGVIYIQYADNAPAFNPLESEDPDRGASLEDWKVGGLGLFLLKKMLDSMDYEYKDQTNIISMTKKMEA